MCIDLRLEAEAEAIPKPGVVEASVLDGSCEDDRLLRASARKALERAKLSDTYGVRVAVRSEIPVARGLKSSSAASNAVVSAVAEALGLKLSAMEILNLAVDSSLEAGVTVTGAFDDASASLLGGLAVTDNAKRLILKRYGVPDYLKVVLLIPPHRRFTSPEDASNLKTYSSLLELAWHQAAEGRWSEAMNLNGLAVAASLGYQADHLARALRNGALAASPSGKGPTLAAVVAEDKVDGVLSAWANLEGELKVVEPRGGDLSEG